MKTRVSVRFFVTDCLWKPFFDSDLLQTSSNLISLTILVTLRLFTLFNLMVEQLSCKKGQKFVLLYKCLSDLSTEVEI